MRLGGLALCALLSPSLSLAQATLQAKITTGASANYTIATEETTFGGDGKKSAQQLIKLPIAIQVLAPNQLQITSGPMFARGRSVGRARVATVVYSPSKPPTNYYIIIPNGGVKVGQSWKAPFYGGPPLPAGIQATYKFSKITPDKRFAVVDMQTHHKAGADMSGKGQFLVNLSNGLLNSGNATFTLAYVRPDQKDPKKMVVNSKTVLNVTIRPT